MPSHVGGKFPILCVDCGPKTVTVSLIINFVEEAISVAICPFNPSLDKILEVGRNASQVHTYLCRRSARIPKVHEFLVDIMEQLSHILSNLG